MSRSTVSFFHLPLGCIGGGLPRSPLRVIADAPSPATNQDIKHAMAMPWLFIMSVANERNRWNALGRRSSSVFDKHPEDSQGENQSKRPRHNVYLVRHQSLPFDAAHVPRAASLCVERPVRTVASAAERAGGGHHLRCGPPSLKVGLWAGVGMGNPVSATCDVLSPTPEHATCTSPTSGFGAPVRDQGGSPPDSGRWVRDSPEPRSGTLPWPANGVAMVVPGHLREGI